MAKCSFCGDTLRPGTGVMFVKKEGTALFFCSRKCERNLRGMGRNPAATRWTSAFQKEKEHGKGIEKGKAEKQAKKPEHKGKQAKKGKR